MKASKTVSAPAVATPLASVSSEVPKARTVDAKLVYHFCAVNTANVLSPHKRRFCQNESRTDAHLSLSPCLRYFQTLSAVKALLAHHHKQQQSTSSKEQLFADEYVVSLVVTLKKIPEKASNKPIPMYATRLPQELKSLLSHTVHLTRSSVMLWMRGRAAHSSLPHSLYNHDGVSICLIVKDPQQKTQEWLDKQPVKGVKQVLGLMKLRKNYHQFEDKRTLCDQHQVFFADTRVIPLLPPLLGKYFFQRKKYVVSTTATP
jgi:hypothetical protein